MSAMSESEGSRGGERQDVRERLLKAGLQIFATRGFDGATVREISERSGCNIAAINYYFGDKRGFFESVKRYAHSLRHASMERTWELAKTDPWQALRQHVEMLLAASYDPMMFYVDWLFLRGLLDADEVPMESEQESDRRRRHYEERMTNLLSQLLSKAAATPKNIKLLRFTFHSLCQFLPIQNAIEEKYLRGRGIFNVTSDLDMGSLADFIMGTVRRTVNDMRRQAGVEELKEN